MKERANGYLPNFSNSCPILQSLEQGRRGSRGIVEMLNSPQYQYRDQKNQKTCTHSTGLAVHLKKRKEKPSNYNLDCENITPSHVQDVTVQASFKK